MSVQQLGYRLMGRGRALFGDDVDRGAWGELFTQLAHAAQQPQYDLYRGTLLRFEGTLWGSLASHGPARWVLPIAKTGTLRQGYGIQFCAACLAADREPYLRLNWRLAFNVWCCVHRKLLADRCCICGSMVAPHRIRTGCRVPVWVSGITHCHECGFDRRLQPQADATDADMRAIEMQEQMQAALDSGVAIGLGSPVHALAYFAGLALLWSLLDDEQGSRRLWDRIGKGNACSRGRAASRYGGIERRAPMERARLLRGSTWLLDQGVDSMIGKLREAGFTRGKVFAYAGRGGPGSVPFWLWQPVHQQLDRTIYAPTTEEIDHAVNFAVRASGTGTARVADVCGLLGFRTSCSQRVRLRMRNMGVIRRAFTARPR